MKAIIQRVSSASVKVDGETAGKTNSEHGLFILLGVKKGDTKAEASLLAEKISKLRIFTDSADKMNLSVKDVCGTALVISNFTLCADYSHGNRPSYFDAEAPKSASELYGFFCDELIKCGVPTERGIFGADMHISAECDGPVTIDMDTDIFTAKKTQ